MWRTIGQPAIIDLFSRAVTHGSLSHAYLLVGPQHSGKMTLATDLAMTLNCCAEQSLRPCGECSSCRKIKEVRHPDVVVTGLISSQAGEETREKTEIGIEQIKEMLHSASLPPFEGRQRVYIIEEAGLLSLDAANRLLKSLEEPPSGVIFLLLTATEAMVPATVISRCQRLNMARIKTGDIEAALVEKWEIEREKAGLLARLSRGCLGWAVETANKNDFREERREQFERMLAMIKGDISERFAISTQLALQFARKRDSVYETLDTWAGWWRDVLLVKTGCHAGVVSFDFSPALAELAGVYNLEQIKDAVLSIIQASGQLKLNANARLALEVMMLNLPRYPSNQAARL
ncbi:MAG: DNA polymerase III subunit delta' [Dehalococcoidales bacterium]|nr:DNA polymerase III subunit delta' [Dehalococcoidales bacterium]